MKTSRAFTLIELLTAVGIVVLLAALVMPAINRARQSAMLAGCASNMRQVGAAALHYAVDNNMRLPRNNSPRWVTILAPYLAAKDGVSGYNLPVFHCPLTPKAYYLQAGAKQSCGLYIVSDRLNGNDWPASPLTKNGVVYPYNGQTFPDGVPLSLIGRPSEVILMGEGSVERAEGGPNMNISDYYPRTARGAGANHRPDNNPSLGDGPANYLFVDGHVETKPLWPGSAAFEVR